MGHNELLVGHAIKGRRDQASSRWGDFVPQQGFEGVRSIALPSAALLEPTTTVSPDDCTRSLASNASPFLRV
jgi:hypothetical protein